MSITQRTTQRITVSDHELDDLRARLRNTRWAKDWPTEPWQAGTDAATLRRLAEYWADGYDWRAQEAAINALPHRETEIGGVRVHFLHFEGGGTPILLANGWPSTFLELAGLADRLAQNGFDVVVPSLPGFTFSDQRPALDSSLPTHELWHRLMHDALGYEHYGVHGSDLGSAHVARLAQAHPESVIGAHLLDVDHKPSADQELTPEDHEYLKAMATWEQEEGAYGHQQRTRPLTLAQGLSDSPTGLLAWIVEKYRAWSDDLGHFSDDFLLTQASLYWFTNTISTSFRDYYERGNGYATPMQRVEVPTAVAWFPGDLGAQWPRSWVGHKVNLTRYTTMPRGGHFAAVEELDLLLDDVSSFFHEIARP